MSKKLVGMACEVLLALAAQLRADGKTDLAARIEALCQDLHPYGSGGGPGR